VGRVVISAIGVLLDFQDLMLAVVKHVGLSISRLHNASQNGANGRSRSAICDYMRLASYPSKRFPKGNIASTVPRQIVHMQNICGRIRRREARIR
jgi:hypothetical protein